MEISVRIYFIRHQMLNHVVGKRVWPYHLRVFHGDLSYESRIRDDGQVDPKWRRPSLLNDSRELPHVTRSGEFVPEIFGMSDLMISPKVHERIKSFPGIDFQSVVFETLVDAPMPPLGDFSSILERNPDHVEEEYRSLPDVPRYHESIGTYRSILAPTIGELRETFPDTQEVSPVWGRYFRASKLDRVSFSRSYFETGAIVRGGSAWVLREDIFTAIAPFLDLDYYLIDHIDLDPPPRINPRQKPVI